ncbi:Thioredoxin domain-containing protein [Stylophora pistillata]|uniref:Thioredoxin domain-containing protein n=1 Tax=Stylophora pistillata TaxID=50429 RepID=A0A2B4RJT1_STYPI|nr:Thioredoxin domain-containing protein [Stylophora pistillata]
MADVVCFIRLCTLLQLVICQVSWSDSTVKILDDNSFEHLTQASTGSTTGDWLIVFSFTERDPECAECKKADEAIEKSQEHLKQGKQYHYSSENLDAESFVRFIEEGYQLAAVTPVPPPVGKFDVFLEEIMDDVRHIIMLRKNAAAMIFIAGILFGLMITPVLKLLAVCLYNSFLQEPDSDQNYEDEGLGKDEVDEDEEVEEKKER